MSGYARLTIEDESCLLGCRPASIAKANQGAAGVDGQSIEDFEANLSGNLYKLWNRMSSGSYFPPPVRRVDIPKASGGIRPLGIPTVADRIVQEIARRYLEPILEPMLHPDSFGYRPGKSAIDAVAKARERCWRYDWVLDLDIKGFFDSIDWELLLKAVRQHTDCAWVLLYIERWLKASVQMEDGRVVPRQAGTPQGGVISPLLANLFLHYAFDKWMAREFPRIPFERYADDVICHCRTKEDARALWRAIADRFAACKLVLHPEKTRIVYCKDVNRRGDDPDIHFDFLGYQFRARKTMWVKPDRRIFAHSFQPAASPKALTRMRRNRRRRRRTAGCPCRSSFSSSRRRSRRDTAPLRRERNERASSRSRPYSSRVTAAPPSRRPAIRRQGTRRATPFVRRSANDVAWAKRCPMREP